MEAEAPTEVRQPRPWIAVVLTVLLPGAGHAYADRVLHGASVLFTIECILKPLGAWLYAAGPLSPVTGALTVLVFLAVIVGLCFEAADLSRDPRPRSGSPGWRTAGFLVVGLFAAFIVEAARHGVLGEPFRSPSASMLPTLEIGDHYYTTPMSYRGDAHERGDILVFQVARDGVHVSPVDRRPDLPKESFVKRVVGLPGDVIEVREGVLRVNGRSEAAPAVASPDHPDLDLHRETLGERSFLVAIDPRRHLEDFGPVTVEEGRYFMLGDNRDHSNDSRSFGTIPAESVVGSVSQIYWSWDGSRPRWERIGLRLR